MENQEKYDELDNIISTIDILIDDISDPYYIDMLNTLKFEAQNDLEEVQEKLQEEYEKEESEMNFQFERSKF